MVTRLIAELMIRGTLREIPEEDAIKEEINQEPGGFEDPPEGVILTDAYFTGFTETSSENLDGLSEDEKPVRYDPVKKAIISENRWGEPIRRYREGDVSATIDFTTDFWIEMEVTITTGGPPAPPQGLTNEPTGEYTMFQVIDNNWNEIDIEHGVYEGAYYFYPNTEDADYNWCGGKYQIADGSVVKYIVYLSVSNGHARMAVYSQDGTLLKECTLPMTTPHWVTASGLFSEWFSGMLTAEYILLRGGNYQS